LYRVGRAYVVTIEPGLEDINGNTTSDRYQFTYQPEPYFRATEIYPEDQKERIPITAGISIRFNSRIDESIFPSLQIYPPLEGTWKASTFDSSSVSFRRYEYLPFNSTFTITVGSTARDAYGNAINHDLASSFNVAPFEVVRTFPSNGADKVELGSVVWAELTGLLDTSTLRGSFSISPATPGYFFTSYGAVNFRPYYGFIPNTTYVVTLSDNLQAYDGTKLSSSYTFSFRTTPFLVNYTSPEDGEFNVYKTRSIYINSSASVDTGSVRGAFAISPPIPGIFNLYDGSSSFTFVPSSSFASNTLYTVTLSTGLRTKSGYALPQPHTFKFKTEQ
jgi:hypothetical protein